MIICNWTTIQISFVFGTEERRLKEGKKGINRKFKPLN